MGANVEWGCRGSEEKRMEGKYMNQGKLVAIEEQQGNERKL